MARNIKTATDISRDQPVHRYSVALPDRRQPAFAPAALVAGAAAVMGLTRRARLSAGAPVGRLAAPYRLLASFERFIEIGAAQRAASRPAPMSRQRAVVAVKAPKSKSRARRRSQDLHVPCWPQRCMTGPLARLATPPQWLAWREPAGAV